MNCPICNTDILHDEKGKEVIGVYIHEECEEEFWEGYKEWVSDEEEEQY